MENDFSNAQKAVLKVGRSPITLIVAIVVTLSFIGTIISGILAPLNLLSNFGAILSGIFIIIGMWIIYGSAHKNQINTSGFKLVRAALTIATIFLIINFVSVVIGFVLHLWNITQIIKNVITLLIQIATFIFTLIYYSSMRKCLNSAVNASTNHPYILGGTFAGVVVIISAVLMLAENLVSVFLSTGTIDAILAFLIRTTGENNETVKALRMLLGVMKIPSIVIAIFGFLKTISISVLIFYYLKSMPKYGNSGIRKIEDSKSKEEKDEKAELEKYKKMMEEGYISKKEYEEKRKKILGI